MPAEPDGGVGFAVTDHRVPCAALGGDGPSHALFVREYVPAEARSEVPVVCIHGGLPLLACRRQVDVPALPACLFSVLLVCVRH